MKNIFLALCFVVLLPLAGNAKQWCQWDGSKEVNCQQVRVTQYGIEYGVINGVAISTPEYANSKGWFELVEIIPPVGPDQATDGVTREFENNVITKRWVVRDLTTAEISQRDTEESANTMSSEMYRVLKVLATTPGIIDTETGKLDPSKAPTWLKDAYLAREALGQ